MTAQPLKRPVLRYHGGKWRLAPWIISHFPAHRVYVEPFGGAASVLMRKPRAELVEVYNEVDPEIANVFRVLRDADENARLRQMLALTPFARSEFALSYTASPDRLEQARRTVVRSFMGFGSDSASGAQTGFRANGNRQNNHPARDWANYPASLIAFLDRLAGVVVEDRDAVDCMLQHDAPRTLHYVDPPYPSETRSRHTIRTGKGYRHEMTAADHVALAAALHAMRGFVVISGYASLLYDRELFPDWIRVTRPSHADGGLDRVEVLWMNPACSAALAQPSSPTSSALSDSRSTHEPSEAAD